MMKNNMKKLIAWTAALFLIFQVLPMGAMAEPNDEQTSSLDPAIISNLAGLADMPINLADETNAQVTKTFIQKDNKKNTTKLNELTADANPNFAYTLQFEAKGIQKDFIFEQQEMRYPAENMTVLSGENNQVSWKFDSENDQIVFNWKKDQKAESFTADIDIQPAFPAANDLTGSYVLGTLSNVLLGTTPINPKGDRARLAGSVYSYDAATQKIYPTTDENPVWTFTHITGDYYTIRSNNTGKYLYLSKTAGNGYLASSLYLVDADEASAQKILVEKKGNAYALYYKDASTIGAVSNAGNKPFNGFATYVNTASGGGLNEQFVLYSPSAIDDEPTKDLSGTWAIVNESKKTILTAKNVAQANKLTGVAYNASEEGSLIPNNNISTWTFEHVRRNWYTVKTEEGYLNISEKGVSVSSNPQHLLAISNDGFKTVILSSGEFAEFVISYALNAPDSNSYGSTKNAVTASTQVSLLDNIDCEDVEIEGRWAIATEVSGAALVAEANGSGKMVSVRYENLEDGTIFAIDKEITEWIFIKKDGNWYTITTEDGKYLTIKDNALTLSDSETLVFVQQHNGKYRITAGNQWALNNTNSNPTAGYASFGNGKAVAKNEWHSLKKTNTEPKDVLVFDINKGTAESTPNAIVGKAGDYVTLPGLEAKKNDEAFIGWAETDNLFVNVTGTNHTYRRVYKPGETYKLKAGATTLYAIYNSDKKNVRFGIRLDGVIQDEPNSYDVKFYGGHFWMNNVLKEGHWVIDIDASKPVNGYYVVNDVTANLTEVPSAEQIAKALLEEGGVVFDPETMYVHWYVLKNTTKEWHVDGVIQKKEMVGITYDTNAGETDKTQIKNMPGSAQVAPGTEVLIGADKNGNLMTPVREGFAFIGWNTNGDGTGTNYPVGTTILLNNNLHLYAQWEDISQGQRVVTIVSDWPEGKIAFAEAEITMTATLIGFGEHYTLQWEYSTDQVNWIPVEGATELTYTYTLNDETAKYYWRIVAEEVTE